MTENQSHSNLKRVGLISAVTVGVVLSLALTLRFALKTETVRLYVKEVIEDQVTASVNGQLTIAALDGDLGRRVTLRHLRLMQQSDTLATVDSLTAEIDLYSIFEPAWRAPQITVHRPDLRLNQTSDSTWNIAQLIPEQEGPPETEPLDLPHLKLPDIELKNGTVSAQGAVIPTGSARIADLSLQSSFSSGGPQYQFDLKRLAFTVEDQPVGTVGTEARAGLTADSLTLEELIISTGLSFLQAEAEFSYDQKALDMTMAFDPIGWQNVRDYSRAYPLRQDLEATFRFSGTLDQLRVQLGMKATGLDTLSLAAGLSLTDTLGLTSAEVTLRGADLPTLTGRDSLPTLAAVDLRAEGNVPFRSPKSAYAEGTLRIGPMNYGRYRIDSLEGTFGLRDQQATLQLTAQRDREEMTLAAKANHLFGDYPNWQADLGLRRINLAYWVPDSAVTGSISMTAGASGIGFTLSDTLWNYRANVGPSRVNGQRITDATITGDINRNRFTNRGSVSIGGSTISFEAFCERYFGRPNFRYRIATQGLNLEDFSGFKAFPTNINGFVEGVGAGYTPADLKLDATLQVDSSLVNREAVYGFKANLSVRDSIATVDSAKLRSTIATIDFSARQNLVRIFDPENRLNLNIALKDISSLAPLLETDKLEAEGTYSGIIAPTEEDQLRFSGDLDLQQVVYGEEVTIEQIRGESSILLNRTPNFRLNVGVKNPDMYGVVLRDLALVLEGKHFGDFTSGMFDIEFNSGGERNTIHRGQFDVSEDSVALLTNELVVEGNQRALTLQKPFMASVRDGRIRVDTLRLEGDEAFLELAFPVVTDTKIDARVASQNLDLAGLQYTLLSKSVLDGFLTSDLTFYMDRDSLFTEFDGRISNFTTNGVALDSVILAVDLQNHELNGELRIAQQNQTIAVGSARLPFRLGDPSTFPDSFFQQPVEGELVIDSVRLANFEELFEQMEVKQTDGVVNFRGELSGRAGSPELEGLLRLDQARISGVAIDSALARFAYNHDRHQLNSTASLHSARQQLAKVTTKVPFYLDLRTFETELPQWSDTLTVDVETDGFNLAALNDFLDPMLVRNVKGRVDGSVRLEGTIRDPQANGRLMLRKGAIRVVPAGMTYGNIRSTVTFAGNEVALEQFRADGGAGELKATGTVLLDRLIPTETDIRLSTNRFQLANTRDINANINTRGQLSGSFFRPQLRGSIMVNNGYYYLQDFGEKTVEKVSLEQKISDNGDDPFAGVSLYDSLDIEIDVSFENNFFIRNRRFLDLEVELDGQLDLLKERDDSLKVYGSLKTDRGYARPLGKTFRLTEGEVTFTGDPGNPLLNITTRYQPPQPNDVTIFYMIKGRAENPEFEYDSEPQMDKQNIFSYTLFGQPFYDMEGWKQVVANPGEGSTVSDLALNVFLDRAETLATQRLGIDVVQIDNTRSGAGSATTIKTGWYLNEKTFFAVLNEISGSNPNTDFLLEYFLRENLKLILVQGDDNRTGIDIRWEYDY